MTPLTTTANGASRTIELAKIGQTTLEQHRSKGKVEHYYLSYTNSTGGTLADGSIIDLGTFGPGRVLPQSFIAVSALGTSRTLDLGYQEYSNVGGTSGAVVAADIDAFIDGLDVAGATENFFNAVTPNATDWANADKTGWLIQGNTQLLAQVNGGTIPNGATIRVHLLVVQY